MNGDLPPQILLYFLTMVPLPNFDKNETGDVLGLMKKTHDSLPNKYVYALARTIVNCHIYPFKFF